jgi:acylphosphatase
MNSKKHIDIFIEGSVSKIDFNFYSQIAASKFGIDAIYKNGDTRHVDIEVEGKGSAVNAFVDYIRNGALKDHIEHFRTEQGRFQNIQGFTSLKVHKEKYQAIKRLFSKKVYY